MRTLHSLALSIISLGVVCSASAVDQESAQLNANELLGQNRALSRDLAFLAAPIKSRADLKSHLKALGVSSPLNQLQPEARARFVNSLTFNEKGLTGFRYQELEELSPTAIYQILALFGQQHTTGMLSGARVETDLDREIIEYTTKWYIIDDENGKDYQGYRCSSRATCSRSASEICTSNC